MGGEQILVFGPFELIPAQRRLTRDGAPLRLGSRALDVLISLIGRAGEVVGKDELIASVWPDTFVEETNLRVHIAALRKALGEDQLAAPLIQNIPGRGYSFVAPITSHATPRARAVPDIEMRTAPSLPLAMVRPVGREEFIASLVAQLPQRRLISIVGPGGIGKTTVAVAAAETVTAQYRDGVAFLDLAKVTDPGLVTPALCALLEPPGAGAPVQDLASALRCRRMLLVFDNCEHLIEAAASLAEDVLRLGSGVQILATSREPLRVATEWVQRLPSLDVPPEGTVPTAAEIGRYPAVQLFIERASECLGGYELRDTDAPLVAEICRRLDGIALAIELAAGRVDAIGISGLANSLDDCFRVLTRGRRTALPRHQTLRATLDWSYGILPEEERLVLRRLSIFAGGFTLEAARAVAGDDAASPLKITSHDVDDAVMSLAAKSLVAADITSDTVHYRLLETTRSYCRGKLEESGEAPALARRHAGYYRHLFERAAQEWETRPTQEWVDLYGREIGNLRAALDWAFSAEGDPHDGIALTVAAVPLWFQLSLVDERLARVKQAVRALQQQDAPDKRQLMQLNVVLGWPQMSPIAGMESGPAAWRTTLQLAEELGDADYQLRALWALWVDRTNSGEPREALDFAERFCILANATAGIADQSIGWRMRGRSLQLLGDQAEARSYTRRMLEAYAPPANRSHLVRFQYDQRVMARGTLARILWTQGYPEQALAEIADNVEETLATGDLVSLCHALSDAACPIALLSGETELAHRYTELLRSHTTQGALDVWQTYGECFSGVVMVRGGSVEPGLALLKAGIERLGVTGFALHRATFLGFYAQGLLENGRLVDAAAAVEQALAACAHSGEAWSLAELCRLKGEILRRGGDGAAAEAALLHATEIARGQNALAWELRTATSLARLWSETGRVDEARGLLDGVMARCTEGFAMADFTAAAELAQTLLNPRGALAEGRTAS